MTNQIYHRLTPYLSDHYGDIASVLGLIVTFVGFVATIQKVKEAQKSAEEARKAAKQVVFRISAQVLVEDTKHLIDVVKHLNSAYRNKEWGFAIYLSEEVKIRIALLKGAEELSEDEKKAIISSTDDFRLLMPKLDKLHGGSELKTFGKEFLTSTSSLIEALCGIKSRATRDLMGKKDV